MKTFDYKIIKELKTRALNGSDVVLPAGSFIKPINAAYLPRHILDKGDYRWSNKEFSSVCYTHFGLVLIDNHLISKID